MTYEEAKEVVVELCDQKIIALNNRIKEANRNVKDLQGSLKVKEKIVAIFEQDLSVWEHQKSHTLLLQETEARKCTKQ